MENLQNSIQQALAKLNIEGAAVYLEHPAQAEHGDWSCNVAMALAKQLGRSPRDLAQEIVELLQEDAQLLQSVSQIEVAGPGFINFYLKPDLFKRGLSELPANFGSHRVGAGKRVMIEFGQPNTHKAFHVGHLKSAISGLGLVKLYENLGYEVIKVNFYGDVGMHVAKCTWGAMQKGLPEDIEDMDVHQRMKWIDSCYVHGAQAFTDSPAAEASIRQINTEIYKGADTDAVRLYTKMRDWSLQHLDVAFASLGIKFDRQYPESEVFAEAIDIVKRHTPQIFEHNEGAVIYDGKKEGLTTWVFLTKEGLPTYEAKDLALAYKKFQEFNPDLSIITTSVEQTDRFKVVIRALERIDAKFTGRYRHLPFGWLLRNHKKTSSRMGESVKGVDVIEEAVALAKQKISEGKAYTAQEKEQISQVVGVGGLKFLILSHEFHKDINYDPDSFISLDGFSGPYIMYAMSRANAVIKESGITSPEIADLEPVLNDEQEMKLIKLLDRYPEATLVAGVQNAPHLLCSYLYQLAQEFNQFYTKLPIAKGDVTESDKQARVLLTSKVAQVLGHGLDLLSIDRLEKM